VIDIRTNNVATIFGLLLNTRLGTNILGYFAAATVTKKTNLKRLATSSSSRMFWAFGSWRVDDRMVARDIDQAN